MHKMVCTLSIVQAIENDTVQLELPSSHGIFYTKIKRGRQELSSFRNKTVTVINDGYYSTT